MITLKSGASLAATAALFALAAASIAPAYAAESDAKTHCYGVNSCKGESDCKAGKHDCKGMNTCKGQGFKEMTAKACAEAGGSTTAPK